MENLLKTQGKVLTQIFTQENIYLYVILYNGKMAQTRRRVMISKMGFSIEDGYKRLNEKPL